MSIQVSNRRSHEYIIYEVPIVEVMSMRVSNRRCHLSPESGIIKWSLISMIDTGIIDKSADLGIVAICAECQSWNSWKSVIFKVWNQGLSCCRQRKRSAVSVQPPCAIACINICVHVKNPKHWGPCHCLDKNKNKIKNKKYCTHG